MAQKKKRIAELTTNVLNPILVSLAVFTLISFHALSSTTDAIRWTIIGMAFSVLPIFIIIIFLLRHQKLGNFFMNVRSERHKIYLLTSICAILGILALPRLGAPAPLVAVYVAGLSSAVVFMLINLQWKISVHTAFIAAAATILIVTFGFVGAMSAMLLPVITWARVELKQHSPAQAISGAVLASVIVVVVFYLFGLVGSRPA